MIEQRHRWRFLRVIVVVVVVSTVAQYSITLYITVYYRIVAHRLRRKMYILRRWGGFAPFLRWRVVFCRGRGGCLFFAGGLRYHTGPKNCTENFRKRLDTPPTQLPNKEMLLTFSSNRCKLRIPRCALLIPINLTKSTPPKCPEIPQKRVAVR